MSSPSFHHRHRVSYSECTVGNHVYYARYLDLLEEARGEFFRSLGVTFAEWQARGVIFPVVECRVQYRAPARYDEVVDVEMWVTELGRVRLGFGCRITKKPGVVVIEGVTTHACTGPDEKPRRVPGELAAALQPYLRGC